MNTPNPIARYNDLAGHFGWLPVALPADACARSLRDAATRAEALYPTLAADLRTLAQGL